MAPSLTQGKLYHPMAPGQVYPITLIVRLRGGASGTFAGRLREIATAVDPALRLERLLSLDAALRQPQLGMRIAAVAIALITLSVVLLSAGGIHALMSFTVTRRQREIAIRSALGGSPRRILLSVFSRVARQLAGGLAIGLAAEGLLDRLTGGELMQGQGIVLLPAIAALMLSVGVVATLGPARRGLRIDPANALKEQ